MATDTHRHCGEKTQVRTAQFGLVGCDMYLQPGDIIFIPLRSGALCVCACATETLRKIA